MKKEKRKITKMIKTNENWHPSFEGGFLQVNFVPAIGRMSVWGADDFGMEMLENTATYDQFKWICSEPITKTRCKQIGMILA